jgi:hypothetical protein
VASVIICAVCLNALTVLLPHLPGMRGAVDTPRSSHEQQHPHAQRELTMKSTRSVARGQEPGRADADAVHSAAEGVIRVA